MRVTWWSRTAPAWLSALILGVVGGPSALGQNLLPGPKAASSPARSVRDVAGLFSVAAIAKAEALLREAEAGSRGQWRTLIETRKSFGGGKPAEVAADSARASGVKGLYLLISRDDRKFQIVPGGPARDALPGAEQTLIGKALTRKFQQGDFDAGLIAAAAEIRRGALAFGVRDHASVFSPEAVAKANATLDEVREATGWQAVIETIETLDNKPIETVVLENSKSLQTDGVYVLIPMREKKVWVAPSASARQDFPTERLKPINDAIVAAFKARRFDQGLTEAVAAFRDAASAGGRPIAAASPAREAPQSPTPPVQTIVPPSERTGNVSPGPQPPPSPIEPTTLPGPGPAPGPVPRPRQPAEATGGGIGPILLLAGGVLIGLWLLSRFRRQARPIEDRGPVEARPIPHTGPSQFAVPQPPRDPGPGYGPTPPAGPGGGFGGGLLGGIGGAVLGNVLYDQFGRPRHDPEPHSHGTGHPPGGDWASASGPIADAAPPARESFDPGVGVGGDWGTPSPSPEPTTGGWAAAEPPEEAEGVGGDWGEPEAGTVEDSTSSGDGWGDEPSSGDSGGSDDQGGSW